MVTTNPFDLLGDDDNDDLNQLLQKLPLPPKKAPALAQSAAATQLAKLPSKPLPPAQADLEEAAKPLDEYASLREFFVRTLKEGSRPIDSDPCCLPGDYHRIHSPVDWNVLARRHFSGRFFPLNERAARTIRNLYVENERIVLEGRWQEGFMAMAAIGATTTGSIEICCHLKLVCDVLFVLNSFGIML
ncbi:hypothetical protein LOK49_LG11G00229 [Camellia lanceoleosa]|uniref:Uncharacterized protein n=1 Tax=Camellia lanceoleosa TaxID=1840588 RepID=A0ACC0G1A0_9ERIC|nr:hypothetical protein LOK49_LG11G00229 [Camellia lanceoleosa]